MQGILFSRLPTEVLSHSLHTGALAARLMRDVQIPGIRGAVFVTAAFLHDLGKVYWSERFFAAPRYLLSNADWYTMSAHPLISADIAQELGLCPEAVEIIRQHHERPGGKGYPLGVEPCEGAIWLSAIDIVAAMTEPRDYRAEIPSEEEIRRELAWCPAYIRDAVLRLVIVNPNLAKEAM